MISNLDLPTEPLMNKLIEVNLGLPVDCCTKESNPERYQGRVSSVCILLPSPESSHRCRRYQRQIRHPIKPRAIQFSKNQFRQQELVKYHGVRITCTPTRASLLV